MSKGIDIPIDSLVTDLTANLWTSNVRSFYGRVFRNERFEIGKVSPEIWLTPNHYIEVLKDYSKDAQCFFDVQPNTSIVSDVHTSDVWLCCMVNLSAIYPLLTRTEATMQVQKDVKDLLLMSQFTINGLITGFEGFNGYDWGEDRTNQAKSDMSPHYLFRYNLSITYVNSCN